MDESMGRLLKALEESGFAPNTIVVFTSDNGVYLGAHATGDKRSAYEESLRVPFIVRYPALGDKARGRIVEEVVLNLDLAPSLLDFAGVQAPKKMQGRSWRTYAEQSGFSFDGVPEPKDLFEIANGEKAGNQTAALEAFRHLGESAGDALGSALTLIDGLAVIGGGVSGAWPLFLPAVVEELNGTYTGPAGNKFRRLASVAYNLEDPAQLEIFLKGEKRIIKVPGSERTLAYDPLQRVGVGMSRLGTSEAVAIGAYAFALQKLGA